MSDALHENDSGETPPSALPAVPALSQLMVHLLKGVLYRDDDERLWASLLRLQARVREQAAVLLLDLVLDEAEGHAFLKSRPDPDESEASAEAYIGAADVKRSGRGQSEGTPRLPRLVARRPLSYPVSLMLALLRKRMAEFDAGGGDTRLVLARDEIAELMRVFLLDGTNEARLIDQVDATITKVVDLGFLRRLKPAAGSAQDRGHYEVRRILKAFVDAQWLFVAAERALAIADDFSGFGSDITALRKKLRGAGCELFDSFPPYGVWFRRRFGIEHEQALELFHQTVSMKSVGNLTDFVRSHMLEPFDVGSRIEALIRHFDDLDRAHQAVLKAKRQVDLLTPLVEDGRARRCIRSRWCASSSSSRIRRITSGWSRSFEAASMWPMSDGANVHQIGRSEDAGG